MFNWNASISIEHLPIMLHSSEFVMLTYGTFGRLLDVKSLNEGTDSLL